MERKKRSREISDYLRILIHQRSTPHAVALGVCIGLFVGLSPLYGLQMVSAFLLAGLLRASRMAAVLCVWVSNAVTAVPIYGFNYLVGSRILGLPMQEKLFGKFMRYAMKHLRWGRPGEVRTMLREVFSLGREVLFPMAVGGLVVAALSSLAVYPVVVWGVSRVRLSRGVRLRRIGMMKRGRGMADES